MMESELINDEVERLVETEDIALSEEETTDNEESKSIDPLSIDYNSRLISGDSHTNPGSSCDMNFYEKENNSSIFLPWNDDPFADVTCEVIEFSDDDDLPHSNSLQKINLDQVNWIGINKHTDSTSTFNQSSTGFKDEYSTDAEYLSEDDGDLQICKGSNNLLPGRKMRKLSGGLSVLDCAPSKDAVKQNSLCSSYVAKSFSNSILLKNVFAETSGRDSPLMSCLEFLKSEVSDDEATDIEEFSVESNDSKESDMLDISLTNSGYCDMNVLEDAFRHRGKANPTSFPQNYNRRSSWTTELLSEDETGGLENDDFGHKFYTRTSKRLSNADEFPNECLTDEELVDLDKEWSETDESGCVRQITTVKTETSINFEGDGAALDNDDLVSTTTTTTTTRVVTSVVSDPDGPSEIESSFIQQLSGDDFKQSCEITFSDTVHEDSRPDDSEHNE